jgi:hypothetical protein
MKISELKTAILLERYEDVAEALKKYKDRDDIFISYSNVPKLGIYPRTDWFTPAGIYCYPLKEMFDAVEKNKVPYASKRPYIVVVQQKPGKNILELSAMTDEQWQHDLDKIKIIWKRIMPRSDAQDIEKQLNDNIMYRAKNQTHGAYFWVTIKELSEQWSEESGKTITVAGNIILRELGYDGITDKAGNGIIHINEPTQAVFLKADVVNLIEILHNKRKQEYPTANHTDEQLANIISKTPSNIRVIRSPPEWLQLIAVKNDGDSIRWIKNPSEQVQLTVVSSYNYNALESILNKKIIPSEKVQTAAKATAKDTSYENN